MIDIESIVFQSISQPLRDSNYEVSVIGETIKTPSKFPCVTLVERDNSVHLQSQDENIENHAKLMYEVNVYSNKITGRKTEVRTIMAIVDKAFSDIGFTRLFMQPIDNLEDSTIYRITARYSAVADNHNNIYRR